MSEFMSWRWDVDLLGEKVITAQAEPWMKAVLLWDSRAHRYRDGTPDRPSLHWVMADLNFILDRSLEEYQCQRLASARSSDRSTSS